MNTYRYFIYVILVIALVSFSFKLQAQTDSLPLPRFASLGSDKINLRTGPGVNYPVEWVYVRQDFPIEIIAEFENWRKIRDREGITGWILKNMLQNKRTVIITNKEEIIRNKPNNDATAIAKLEQGVIARLLSCHQLWCKINVQNYEGWIKQENFWGTYSGEDFNN
ncbi:MAG: SH3 domain-containing protein [Alphaproteobacteria bacterium]|nr:SH3 domain-containing protein [Alphaproteobacteria bacterium]